MVSGHSQLAAAVFEATDEAIVVTNADNAIVAVNPAFTRVTGYDPAEALGRNPNLLASGRHSHAFYAEMWETLLATGHWHGEIWDRRKNGELYAQRLTISLIRDANGQVVNHVGIFSDITKAKQREEQISHNANYDILTGLPNRVLLSDRLSQALAKATRENSRLAILFVDLDGFKEVNDRLGHLTGDYVLEVVAARLEGCVRQGDTVARLGGDEFIILLTDMGDPADAEITAGKVLGVLTEAVSLNGATASVGASIGIAAFPISGTTAETLLRNADSAMYAAKRAGKNCFAWALPEGYRTKAPGRASPGAGWMPGREVKMPVTEVMSTDVRVVEAATTLRAAAELMRQLGTGFLPVGENDRLVGTITDRDIAVRAVCAGKDPNTTQVGEVMTPQVVCCFDDQDTREAASLMGRKRIRRLPVLDRQSRLVGVLTLGDIAGRTPDERIAGHTLRDVARQGSLG